MRKPPQQQRSQVMVQNLIEATARAFDRRGLHLTTRDVAEEAGVSVGSLYQYFKNKDELLEHSGIARLTSAQFAALTGEQYLRRRQTPQGGTELLLDDRAAFARRHPEFVVDPATIDDIMLFYAKGEAQ